MIALLQCPFCESTEVSMSYSATMQSPEPAYRFVECDECGACGPSVKINDPLAKPSAEESAIEGWNGAAGTIAELIEALERTKRLIGRSLDYSVRDMSDMLLAEALKGIDAALAPPRHD